MIKIVLQNIGAILLSMFVAILLLAGIEWIGTILHPFPADFAGTREEVVEHVANYPSFGLFVGGIGWVITMFIAAWLATRINANRHPAYGIGIGLLFFAGAVFNMSMLPYPLWYWALNLIMLPAAIYFGCFVGKHSETQQTTSRSDTE